MNTSAPQRRAAPAWFAPFPPNPRPNLWPKMVSPGFGNRSANVVKSMLALPTTATRGGMIYSQESCDRRVYLAPLANVNLDSGKRQLLAVRNPDVLHLGCVLQIPPAFASLGVKPIDG